MNDETKRKTQCIRKTNILANNFYRSQNQHKFYLQVLVQNAYLHHESIA